MMHRTVLAGVALLAGLTLMGWDAGSAVESERADAVTVEKEAAQKRERSAEAAELERRAANLESQWTEMQTKVETRESTATAGLREEVQEEVENWWDPHERDLERSVIDVQADFRD